MESVSIEVDGSSPTESVSIEEVQKSLLEEITAALNVSDANQASRIQEFESELSGMFQALPKTEQGTLGHATVHYALHRLFIERHGWSFKGLEPAGAAWGSMASAGILKDRVPSYIQELFEEQLGGQGFALQELAVLAATLEHLVNNEAREKLQEAFKVLNVSVDEKLSKEKFDEVLDTYVVAQISKTNVSDLTLAELAQVKAKVANAFSDYAEAQGIVREIASKYSSGVVNPTVDFSAASLVVSESGKHLGRWHKNQCQSKKERLIAQGDQQVGRVPLSNFYAAALTGTEPERRQTEHIDYLRELGAIDESVPQRPSVLVPNYMDSLANCFAASSFYSICCPNECESLMHYLELQIAAPTAKPAQIQKIIGNLPSTVVSEPRDIPHDLQQRLEEIAQKNEGEVPIHGRLFAQWLHHAYPRECPYPHAAGVTRPQTADEWMADTGKESSHTREEMEDFVKKASEYEVTDNGDLTNAVVLPWSDDEELLVVRPHARTASSPPADAVPMDTVAADAVPSDTADGAPTDTVTPTAPEQGRLWSIIRYFVFALALSMMFWRIKEQITGLVGISCATLNDNMKAKKDPSV